MSRAVVQAVKVGETMGEEVQLVHVTLDPAEGERFRERVERQLPGVRVVLVESPYRALVRPFVRYLEVSQAEDPDRLTIVLLPEHLPRHWWDRILYNQNVHRIRAALVGRKDFVVLDTPYRRERRSGGARPDAAAVVARAPGRRPGQTSIMLPGVATSMAPR